VTGRPGGRFLLLLQVCRIVQSMDVRGSARRRPCGEATMARTAGPSLAVGLCEPEDAAVPHEQNDAREAAATSSHMLESRAPPA
jgi:hypothetical protein